MNPENADNVNGEGDQQVLGPLRNIILVGTKADLCRDDGPVSKNKRQVKFSESVNIAKKLSFAGCMEVSSRLNTRSGF